MTMTASKDQPDHGPFIKISIKLKIDQAIKTITEL
jgi:hypothetical protein